MNKIYLILLLLFVLVRKAHSQDDSASDSRHVLLYFDNSFNISNTDNTRLRFSILPNLTMPIRIIMGRNRKTILTSGLFFNNIGIRYKEPSRDSIRALRGISVGIPLEYNIPDNKAWNYFSVGLGYEYVFHTKQKIITDGNKVVTRDFFSKKTNRHLFYGGIAYRTKFAKFSLRYYLNDFLNRDYAENSNGMEQKIFAGKKSNIIYFSIGFPMIQGVGLSIGN